MRKKNEKTITLGFSGAYGNLKENVKGSELDYKYSQNKYILSPFVQYDKRGIGLGLGVNAGDMSIFRNADASFTNFG